MDREEKIKGIFTNLIDLGKQDKKSPVKSIPMIRYTGPHSERGYWVRKAVQVLKFTKDNNIVNKYLLDAKPLTQFFGRTRMAFFSLSLSGELDFIRIDAPISQKKIMEIGKEYEFFEPLLCMEVWDSKAKVDANNAAKAFPYPNEPYHPDGFLFYSLNRVTKELEQFAYMPYPEDPNDPSVIFTEPEHIEYFSDEGGSWNEKYSFSRYMLSFKEGDLEIISLPTVSTFKEWDAVPHAVIANWNNNQTTSWQEYFPNTPGWFDNVWVSMNLYIFDTGSNGETYILYKGGKILSLPSDYSVTGSAWTARGQSLLVFVCDSGIMDRTKARAGNEISFTHLGSSIDEKLAEYLTIKDNDKFRNLYYVLYSNDEYSDFWNEVTDSGSGSPADCCNYLPISMCGTHPLHSPGEQVNHISTLQILDSKEKSYTIDVSSTIDFFSFNRYGRTVPETPMGEIYNARGEPFYTFGVIFSCDSDSWDVADKITTRRIWYGAIYEDELYKLGPFAMIPKATAGSYYRAHEVQVTVRKGAPIMYGSFRNQGCMVTIKGMKKNYY